MNKAEMNAKIESLERALNFAAAQLAHEKSRRRRCQEIIGRFRCPWYKRWWLQLRWVMKGKP